MPVSRPVVDSAKAARHLRKRRADKPQVDKLRAVGATAGTALQLGELSELLGYALKRAQLKVFDDFLRCVAPLQLTPAPFSVLLLLDRNPGRNQSEIAITLGIYLTLSLAVSAFMNWYNNKDGVLLPSAPRTAVSSGPAKPK